MQADGSMLLTSGRLVLGPKAEKRFGRKHHMDLYAVFSTPALYRVHTTSGQEIGTLSQDFVDRLVADASTFQLGGRPWSVTGIRHKDKIVQVQAAPRGREPTWGGFLPQFLSLAVCQQIRALLLGAGIPGYLHPTAQEVLLSWRERLAGVLSRSGLELDDGEARWWTFAGGRINSTLRYALQASHPGWKVTPGNLELRIKGEDLSLKTVLAAIDGLRTPELWESEGLWRDVLAGLPSYRLSKFQLLMPPWMVRERLASFLLDVSGTWEFLESDRAPLPGAVAALTSALTSSEETPPPPEVVRAPQEDEGLKPKIPIQ